MAIAPVLFIDFNGCYANNFTFVVKEFGAIPVYNRNIFQHIPPLQYHTIVTSPYPEEDLQDDAVIRKQAYEDEHCIPWNLGVTPIEEVMSQIASWIGSTTLLFCKDDHIAHTLQLYFPRNHVTTVFEENCPPLAEVAPLGWLCPLPHHELTLNKCVVSNLDRMYVGYKLHLLENLEEDEELDMEQCERDSGYEEQ